MLLVHSEVHKCMRCAQCCYLHEEYTDCVAYCDAVLTPPIPPADMTGEHRRASLLKGKALAYLYRKHFVNFMCKRSSLSEMAIKEESAGLLDEMKKIVRFLGQALDANCIDAEGSQLLDTTMLDCMREFDKLIECRRCLLCRKRTSKKNMRRSHMVPLSVLKKLVVITPYIDKSDDQKVFLPLTGKLTLKTPRECTFGMLCDVCEQRLSQNAEMQFVEQFFSKVHTNEGSVKEAVTIRYDASLYIFCLSIIFRGLAIERFSSLLNADEVYVLYDYCRRFLSALPAKKLLGSVTSAPIEPLPASAPCVSFLITPTFHAKDAPSVKTQLLCSELNTTGIPFLGLVNLDTGKPTLSRQAHFFVGHFGNCNIIVKFGPSSKVLLPKSATISYSNGIYYVPEEHLRNSSIPPGLWVQLLGAGFTVQKTLSTFMLTDKLEAKRMKERNQMEDVSTSGKIETAEELEWLRNSIPGIDSRYLSDFINAPTTAVYLPKGYHIHYSTLGFVNKIELPTSHQVILHCSNQYDDKKHVILLCTGKEENLYLIGHFRGIRAQVLEYLPLPDVDDELLGNLEEKSTICERETQKKLLQYLPKLLEARGFHGFHSFAHFLQCHQ